MSLDFWERIVDFHEVPQCCYSKVQGGGITCGLVDINLF